MKKYYKIIEKNSIIMFYHDLITDCLQGVIEEYKTNEKLIMQKYTTGYYSNVSTNSLAQGMIKKAIEITQNEYEIASDVLNAMINTDEMFLDVSIPVEKNAVIVEPTYV